MKRAKRHEPPARFEGWANFLRRPDGTFRPLPVVYEDRVGATEDCDPDEVTRPVVVTLRPYMTDAEVIDAVRADHLHANIADATIRRVHWDGATVDPGGSLFGPGPYLKVPADRQFNTRGDTERVTIRVYAPARLRRKLAAKWVGTPVALPPTKRLRRARADTA